MNPIVKLLKSGTHEDNEIARAILLSRYRDNIAKLAYEIWDGYYIIGFTHLVEIIKEPVDGDYFSVQFDFTEEELFNDLKKEE